MARGSGGRRATASPLLVAALVFASLLAWTRILGTSSSAFTSTTPRRGSTPAAGHSSRALATVGRRAKAIKGFSPEQQQALQSLKKSVKVDFPINEEIRSEEVRVIGELSDDPKAPEMKDVNEVLMTKDALARARSRGLDLVMVNEDADPPAVKIVGVGKYVYDQKKKEKDLARRGKALKVKEVKMSYVIGEHDLNTNLRKMEKWLENSRQQVRVTIVMKGRTRMFEKQARELLMRVRKEVAPYGKVGGADKGGGVMKDGRGDLYAMFSHGGDVKLMKEMKEEVEMNSAGAGGTEDSSEGMSKGDSGDDDEDSTSPSLSKELAEVQAEMEEMKQELLDCGINPGQVNQQEEMIEILSRLSAVKAKISAR